MTIDMDGILREFCNPELRQGLEELFPRHNFSFGDLLAQVLEGDVLGALKYVFGESTDYLISELNGCKSLFVWLILLGLFSAMVSQFSDIFEKKQVADLSFYFMYLLLMTILMMSFQTMADTTVGALQGITEFMKLLVPTYLLVVGVVHGTVTAAASGQLLLFVVYGIEVILAQVLMPLIYAFFFLVLMNGLWSEEKLSMLLEFMEKVIRLILKGAIGVVTGFSIFQTLIAPVVDMAKDSVVEKLLRGIPGIGNMTGSLFELTIGSAMIIKNGIGVVLLILLLVLCAGPLIRIGITACILKGAAALMGILSDRRMVHCADKAGDAGWLLFRTTGGAMLLFMIAIAVITAARGGV